MRARSRSMACWRSTARSLRCIRRTTTCRTVIANIAAATAAAAAVAAAILAMTVRQVVVRRMQRKLRAVERQQAIERDRARIAQDIHDDLGAGLTQIMLLSELARREPSHEIPSHLGQISDMA